MHNFVIKPHPDKTLRWWFDNRDQIDFDPSYQRPGGIWPIKNKSFLIDTILNGYDIPKIYVADFRMGRSPLNQKKKTYAIIDGKQRFEAIFNFFQNNFALGTGKPFKYEHDLKMDLNGLTYSVLKNKYPDIATTLDNYIVSVISVWANIKGPIESLFVRLNTAVPACGAERRNALPGPTMDIVRHIAKHTFFEKNIRFNKLRMAQHNAAIKLLWIEYNNRLMDTKKSYLDNFAEKKQDKKKLSTSANTVNIVLDKMSKIFMDNDILLGNAGIIPLYYWFAKHLDTSNFSSVRSFLNSFEKKRKLNLQRKEKGGRGVDETLLVFDKNRRSPNDSRALSLMYKTLLEYYKMK